METEDFSGGETMSYLSAPSMTSVSVMDAPTYLRKEYEPLEEVFASHSVPLPKLNAGVKDSNSDAMISALKTLQDKIRALELQRASAADQFKCISEETKRAVTLGVASGSSSDDTTHRPRKSPKDDHYVNRRLDSLDTQFTLQAKELELMRERLRQAEVEREMAKTKSRQYENASRKKKSPHRSPQLPSRSPDDAKLKQLEAEQSKLRASHATTESKLRKLEGKLLHEQMQRRQARSTKATPSEVLISKENLSNAPRKKSPLRRKKEKGCGTTSETRVTQYRPVPGIHYHLNMKDVPFVVGTSTSPSHSLSANYQRVLSLMKYHNPVLCGAAAVNIVSGNQTAKKKKGPSKKATRSCEQGASTEELQGLLDTLEEEFGQLTYEYQEVAELLQQQGQAGSVGQDASDENAEDYEPQLNHLVDKLEGKMEQIQVVKQLLQSRHRPPTGPSSKARMTMSKTGHQVQIVTSTKKPNKASSSSSTDSSQESLRALRNMKMLQQTLQRDDLSWN